MRVHYNVVDKEIGYFYDTQYSKTIAGVMTDIVSGTSHSEELHISLEHLY